MSASPGPSSAARPCRALSFAALLLALAPVGARAEAPPRAELPFAPDRPGVGDSAASAPLGRALVEGGISLSGEGLREASGPGAVLRIGVGSQVEMRVGLPSAGGGGAAGLAISGPALGLKVAGAVGDALSWSIIPTAQLAPLSGAGEGSLSLGLNGVYSTGALGLWVNAVPAYGLGPEGGVGISGGGGASYGLGPGGVYVNGGFTGADPFAGGGVWILLAPAVQLDLGVDVAFAEAPAPTLMIGTSFIL